MGVRTVYLPISNMGDYTNDIQYLYAKKHPALYRILGSESSGYQQITKRSFQS